MIDSAIHSGVAEEEEDLIGFDDLVSPVELRCRCLEGLMVRCICGRWHFYFFLSLSLQRRLVRCDKRKEESKWLWRFIRKFQYYPWLICILCAVNNHMIYTAYIIILVFFFSKKYNAVFLTPDNFIKH